MGEKSKRGSDPKRSDSAFVDRTKEISIVERRLEDLKKGEGNIIFISGEEGIGKSSLLDKVFQSVEDDGINCYSGRCASREVGPYHPFLSALDKKRRTNNDTPKSISIGLLQPTKSKISEIINMMKTGSSLQEISNKLKKYSDNRKIVFAIEDIHWADKQSLLFIRFLIERIDDAPILIICTYRPEETEGYTLLNETMDYLAQRKNYTHIKLKPFDKQDSLKMVENILGKPPSKDFLDYVYDKTEGNPLFLKELVTNLKNDDDVDVDGHIGLFLRDEIDWPKVIEYSVERRSIRLEDETRKVLRSLAVLGDRFSFDLAVKYLDYEEMELLDHVEKLRDRGFLVEIGETENYRFSHSVFRDVIYRSLSKVRKRMLHSRAANAIENTPDNGLQDPYFQLGYHYKICGNLEKAAEFYKKAAERVENKASVCKTFKIIYNLIDIFQREPKIGMDYVSVVEEEGKILYEHVNRLKEIDENQAHNYLKKAVELFEKAGVESMVDTYRESIEEA